MTFWADFLKITSRLASSNSSQNDYEKQKQVLLVGKLLSSNSIVSNYKKNNQWFVKTFFSATFWNSFSHTFLMIIGGQQGKIDAVILSITY